MMIEKFSGIREIGGKIKRFRFIKVNSNCVYACCLFILPLKFNIIFSQMVSL